MQIGILNPPLEEVPTFRLGTEDFSKAITANLGNLMFRYAGTLLYRQTVPVFFSDDPHQLENKVDGLIYPTANILNSTVELGGHAKFFSALKVPYAVLGMGLQTSLENPFLVAIKPASQNFFKLIASKSKAISVRGDTTKAVFEKNFAGNCVVTGCPSNFISNLSDDQLGDTLERRFQALKIGRRPLVRIAYHPQHGNNYYNDNHSRSERFLFRQALASRGSSYICNGPHPIFSASRNRLSENQYTQDLKKLHEFLSPETGFQAFIQSLRSVALSFGSLLAWLEFLSAQDLVVGKRVHGCIAAMQCGVPAILIVHDSRTLELAQTIGIPHLPLSFFDQENLSPEALLDAVKFSAEDYARKRTQLRSNLNAVLEENGLPPMECQGVTSVRL